MSSPEDHKAPLHPCKVLFDELAWQTPLAGLRVRAHRANGKQLRIAEFSAEFIEPEWCEKGHAGYVLEGILEVQFHGGTVTYRAGDGLLIPPGYEHGHKARSLTPITRVVLVEDV